MRTSSARGASAIGLGLIAATAATYGLHAVAARNLSASEFGVFGSYWSLLFTVNIIAYLAVEQNVAARVASQQSLPLDRRFVESMFGLGVLAGLGTALPAVLVDGSPQASLILGLASASYLPVYLLRGALAGHSKFRAYGRLFAGEALLRLAAFLGLSSAGTAPLNALVWSLLVAPLVVSIVAVSFLRRIPRDRSAWHGSLSGIGGAAVANIGLVAIVNLGPIIVEFRGSSAAAGILFASLLVVRAPLYFSQALVVTLLPRLVERLRDDGFVEVRHRVRAIALWSIPAAAVVVAASTPLLRWAVGYLFDEALVPSPVDMALLGPGVVLIVGGLAINQFWIAAERPSVIARGWTLGVMVFLGAALIADDPILGVSTGVLIGGSALVVALLLPTVRGLAAET